ncbi:MAG: hypothetical protein HDS30_04060 [Bacteroides sp.]|nr:hypothetical protein [Bacteroides sp.]MDE6043480.1 hypothetical protein [Muribaculaceae bacterium]
MKKYLLMLLALVAVAVGAAAQNSVKWRTAVRMVSPTEGEVTVRAIIPEGFHMYGTKAVQGGPVATTFNYDGSTGVEFSGKTAFSPAPVSGMDEAFGTELQWWTGRVAFTRKFRVTDAAKARIAISVKYMMCNGANCMPPRTENIVINADKLKQ